MPVTNTHTGHLDEMCSTPLTSGHSSQHISVPQRKKREDTAVIWYQFYTDMFAKLFNRFFFKSFY